MFGCYSVLSTLPYIFVNIINVIKAVKIILELFKLAKHSCNIQ